MEVSRSTQIELDVAPRRMTQEAMQKDFEYEMAQKIARNMLEQDLISIDEYDRISALNRVKFSPFYGDLMEK